MGPGGSYDVVVVGAGTAGCVISARISEDPDKRVLLLEAGSGTTPSGTSTPETWLARAADGSWTELSTVQAATGLAAPLVLGRGIGGSSAINGMMYTRGHRTSYDRWQQSGAAGWGFDDLLPYFKRSETAESKDPAVRGTDGPLRVAPQEPLHVVIAACLSAAVESGFPAAKDISGGLEVGFGPVDANIVAGQRQSAVDAYLDPALRRANLDFVPDAVTQRLRIVDGRCTGVEYVAEGGHPTYAEAAQVVLTAGTVGSPQLLMRSGIGPGGHLREVGIDVVCDLPGVGANLHDHLLVPIVYRASTPMPVATSNHGEVVGLLCTGLTDDAPDLQIMLSDSGLGILPGLRAGEAGYGMFAAVMQPFSRGSVRLSGPDVGDSPLIDPNYFGDDRDMLTALSGLRLIREIGRASALDYWRGDEVAPGVGVDDDAGLREYVKNTFQTYFHLVGTCAIGSSEMSVVDSELRVFGIEGLRVADASVMPSIPSGNTNATVYAIGERAAELIARG
jgi:choline dehydrogenase